MKENGFPEINSRRILVCLVNLARFVVSQIVHSELYRVLVSLLLRLIHQLVLRRRVEVKCIGMVLGILKLEISLVISFIIFELVAVVLLLAHYLIVPVLHHVRCVCDLFVVHRRRRHLDKSPLRTHIDP